MPQRSWLAKAKSIHDIGGLFCTGAWPYDEKRDAQAERRWRNAGATPFPATGADLLYFGSAMHDSGVIAIERTPSTLRMRLDSINANDFSGHLSRVLDLPHVETEWPVDLVSNEPRLVRAARADRRGGLRFVDPDRLVGCEFLYDWAFQQEGRLQWIAQLWRWPEYLRRGDLNVYLMVDAARMTAEDRCPLVFARHYGEAAAAIYRDAVAGIDERPIDFNVWDDARRTPEYVLRRMAARGLTRRDFIPDARASGRGPSARG